MDLIYQGPEQYPTKIQEITKLYPVNNILKDIGYFFLNLVISKPKFDTFFNNITLSLVC